MPLTWGRVTIASRLMLPVHAFMSAGIGLAWVTQDPDRTKTKALTLLNLWPITNTAIILLVLAASVVVGILTRRRNLAAIALGGGMLVYAALAALILGAAFVAHASYSGALWPAYVALAHLASILSLAHDEITERDHGNGRGRP